MKYQIEITSRFKRDYKLAVKRGLDIKLMEDVITILADGGQLLDKHKDHALCGNWDGYRECHIAPDRLLVYKVSDDVMILVLVRTGSHNDLF